MPTTLLDIVTKGALPSDVSSFARTVTNNDVTIIGSGKTGVNYNGITSYSRIPNFLASGNGRKEMTVLVAARSSLTFGYFIAQLDSALGRCFGIRSSNTDSSGGAVNLSANGSDSNIYQFHKHIVNATVLGFRHNNGTLTTLVDDSLGSQSSISTLNNASADITIGCYLSNGVPNGLNNMKAYRVMISNTLWSNREMLTWARQFLGKHQE